MINYTQYVLNEQDTGAPGGDPSNTGSLSNSFINSNRIYVFQ